jgi:HlyD family secretion protein
MDVPRESQRRRKIVLRVICGVIILAVVGGVTLYVSKMKPAAPSVDRSSIWVDTVKHGSMLQAVRGLGRLVPEEIRWIPAATEGRVERKVLEPGARVTPDTVLIELSNPQLEQETVSAEWDWKADENSYTDLQLRLRREDLTQKADLARMESDYEQARIKYESRKVLGQDGLISALDLREYQVAAEQSGNRLNIEKERAEINRESMAAQLSERRTRVDQRKAVYEMKKNQLEQLKVRAGVDGILQQIEVDVGQRIGAGTNLARVVNPNRLKAELSVSETQAKDVQLGQAASIDTRNGVIQGRVSRVDPAVRDGAVTVDIRIEGELPKGARPDLSVDGTIVLEQLDDVVYVGLPVQAQADSQISLFKLAAGGKEAHRVKVQLGRSSVSTVEVREGLKPGDQVVLSDMSAQDGFDDIRLIN